MENNLNEQVLDKITKVCTCKAIPRSKIKDKVENKDLEHIDMTKDTFKNFGLSIRIF